MTEELKCIGAKQVTIDYKFFHYATRVFGFYVGIYDNPSQRISRIVRDFTEGGITHSLSDTLIDITNENNRLYPNTYANLVAFSGDVKVLDLLEETASLQQASPEELIENGIYENLVTTNYDFDVTDTPSFTEDKTYIFNKIYTTSGVKLIIERLNSFDSQTRFKIQEINPTTNQIIRNVTIENSLIGTIKGYKITCDNEELSCVKSNSGRVEYFKVEPKIFDFTKNANTGVKISNFNNLTSIDYFLEEINVDNNEIISSKLIDSTSDTNSLLDFDIICIKKCSDNTCSVDCGDKVCCYGSDGIAVDYYLK